MASSGSSIFSPVVAEVSKTPAMLLPPPQCVLGFVIIGEFLIQVDGVGIVEHVSEFYLPDESYCGLEHSSKHRCPGHDRVPARRVAWGGANTCRRFLGCPLDVRSCEL